MSFFGSRGSLKRTVALKRSSDTQVPTEEGTEPKEVPPPSCGKNTDDEAESDGEGDACEEPAASVD